MGLTISPTLVLDESGAPSGAPHTPSSRMRTMERPDTTPPGTSLDSYRIGQLEEITRSLTVTATDLRSSVGNLASKMDAFAGAHFPASDGRVVEGRVARLEKDVDTINSRAWVLWVAVIQGGAGMIIALILAALRWQSHGG